MIHVIVVKTATPTELELKMTSISGTVLLSQELTVRRDATGGIVLYRALMKAEGIRTNFQLVGSIELSRLLDPLRLDLNVDYDFLPVEMG